MKSINWALRREANYPGAINTITAQSIVFIYIIYVLRVIYSLVAVVSIPCKQYK